MIRRAFWVLIWIWGREGGGDEGLFSFPFCCLGNIFGGEGIGIFFLLDPVQIALPFCFPWDLEGWRGIPCFLGDSGFGSTPEDICSGINDCGCGGANLLDFREGSPFLSCCVWSCNAHDRFCLSVEFWSLYRLDTGFQGFRKAEEELELATEVDSPLFSSWSSSISFHIVSNPVSFSLSFIKSQ